LGALRLVTGGKDEDEALAETQFRDVLREAFREGTIDAYGNEEQHESLFNVIDQELEFPFEARSLAANFDVDDL
jgi:hypothetical protein